jgi:hypothetical protein
VQHEGDRADQGTDNQHHGGGQDQQQYGVGCSLRPRMAVPPTVLRVDRVDGLSSGPGEAL